MRTPFRLRRALGAALVGVAAVGLAVPATVATAATRTGSDADAEPVGGPLLGSRGLVVSPGPGIRMPPAVHASSYVLADLDSGAILATKDPHGRFAPASTLKILTAATFVPLLDADQLVTATYESAAVDGTKVGVVPRMRYSVRELMTAMLIMSANDAATVVASAQQPLGQGIRMMNEEAARLHARDTVARSASGLDAKGQLSSAYDLSLIARAGLALPDFRVYVKTIRSSFSAPHKKKYEIYTHNHLLLNYKGTFGVKNGYTVRAKASFVGAAERNGRRLVVSLMHGEPLLWKDAARLLDWGFAYAGAVSPVGRLVDPQATPLLDDGSGHAATTSALTRQTKSSGFGVPLAPLAAAVGILVVLTGLRLRARRRRGLRLRSRSKFSLPPI